MVSLWTIDGVTGNWSTHRFRNPAARRFLAVTAHSTRNLVMASVQRCAAQHPGRRAAETVCRQFQCPRLHSSRRHLRQIWLSWRHGLPLRTGIWGGEDAEFEPDRKSVV